MILNIVLWCLLWLAGYVVAFVMQRTEIAAEQQPYTFGDRLLISAMSLLSWLWVLVILVTAWVATIKRTGFWAQPVTPEADVEVVVLDEKGTKKPTTTNRRWPKQTDKFQEN